MLCFILEAQFQEAFYWNDFIGCHKILLRQKGHSLHFKDDQNEVQETYSIWLRIYQKLKSRRQADGMKSWVYGFSFQLPLCAFLSFFFVP